MKFFKDLYNYRELLKTNIKKEIRGKYKGAWLGVIWSFLNPLLMLLVYAFVFPYILRINVENYTIYLMVALIPWNFFTTVVQMGSGCIVSSGNILKKVYFPREIIPISVATSGLVNFFITAIVMFAFIMISGVNLTAYALLFPLIAVIEYLFLLGIVFIVSSITVFIRDLEHLISVFLLVLFYVTPVIYNSEMIPEKFSWIIKINPMAYLIQSYREILYYGTAPNYRHLFYVFILSLLIIFFGFLIFKKTEKRFAEEL